ncbi:MAG: recombinase family protein, partial [Prevotellaceae bacterium]|nr:recombinase family protein [Prevotellaceae bacterium]
VEIMKTPNCSNIKPKLEYSMLLINSIDKYMRDAKVEVKCKLIGSMFPEKITFDGKSYQTNAYNSVLNLIYQQTKQLQGTKKKKGGTFESSSNSVPGVGLEPTQG